MKCPQCGHMEDKVVDSRTTKEGEAIRRRRECLKCGRRYTTYEYIERAPWIVVKKDGRREQYDREKILAGLIKACEKRPISRDQLEKLREDVEGAAFGKFKGCRNKSFCLWSRYQNTGINKKVSSVEFSMSNDVGCGFPAKATLN